MKNYVQYAAAAIVGLASLLPSYGCGKSGLGKKKHEPKVAGLRDIRATIDDFLNAADPNGGQVVEIVFSDAVGTDVYVRDTEGLAALEVWGRLQSEVQLKYNTSRIMVTGRPASHISDLFERSRIYVGAPGNNKLVADALAGLPDQNDAVLPNAGTGRVYGVDNSNGTFMILVTANDIYDVRLAGFALSEYDNYINFVPMDFNHQIVNVTGNTSSPQTTGVK